MVYLFSRGTRKRGGYWAAAFPPSDRILKNADFENKMIQKVLLNLLKPTGHVMH